MDIEETLGLVAIVGEEGTCKSTMSLTFPQKVAHFELDIGGFKRAVWRLPSETRVKKLSPDEDMGSVNPTDFDVLTKPYPRKIQMSKLLGQEVDLSSRKIGVKFPKKVEGMRELWQSIMTDFVAVAQMPDIKSIIFDSGTQLWIICHSAYLQELQEKQLLKYQADPKNKDVPFDENDYRERLQKEEYGQPNERMRLLFHTANSFGKNTVMTFYPTDVYGPMPDGRGGFSNDITGEKRLDGFKETAKFADVVLWTSLKVKTIPSDPKIPGSKPKDTNIPIAKFAKAGVEGMGISAVGMEIPASYQSIINLRNLMRGGT